MEIVRYEGNRRVKRNINIYNLDMIISVGYRVNSKRLQECTIVQKMHIGNSTN